MPWLTATVAVSLVLPVAAMGAGLPDGLLSGEQLWTDRPVRIDRAKQTFERIEIERPVLPLSLDIPSRVIVFDSTSFLHEGRIYVLNGGIAVGPRRLCHDEAQRVFTCGQQARLYLKRLIATRTLQCRELYRVAIAHFVDCYIGGRDLSEILVAKGAAWAATRSLQNAQRQSMNEGRGIWTDTECRAQAHCASESTAR
ncbi:hypothetical protein [Sinorhizobium sp. BG8]|uniref:thermonuclease family protein n=1 Tax=Sinorhizobium sp. BG8 TaxID=2613773 RepID=UPI00193D1931|nr:hypothetical protein [Sinorhizobium sp. BG8]QRM53418.1 hypothetical protein F3Y30_01715 [Sinorhizobium sp. BG8]